MRRVSKARVVWARILIVFQIFSFNSPLRVLSAAQPSGALPSVRSFPHVPPLSKARTSGSNVRSSVSSVVLPGLKRGMPAARSAEAVGTPTPPLPCDAPANAIVAENCLTGNPSTEWNVTGSGDPNLQGFATDISVNRGETVSFKIKTSYAGYRLDIYRMGYYGGLGARKVATVPASQTLVSNQPACLTDATTGLVDCGNWAVTASWPAPATAPSGIYFAKVVRDLLQPGDVETASHIFFVVRDDSGHSDLLMQTSDTTWQAYNRYGGNSLYTGQPAGRAYKVSYNRPFTTRDYLPQTFVFDTEYPMVRWLEANGYNVSYFTGVDSDRLGSEILEHKIFLSVGHDEYWSGAQRASVEAARSAGVSLAFLSGNEIFWKTRWESSIDGSGASYRTLVCYKETQANAKIDPSAEWTGTWRDPRFSPPADGARPENALTGNMFMVNSGGPNPAIQVPPAEGKTRFWRNTSVATQAQQGGTTTLPAETIGYEWDMDVSNSSRPPGLIHLSSTTVSLTGTLLTDYGSTYGSGVATHTLTLYRHSSGALVFGAGTIRWPWGLDANHDGTGGQAASTDMRQATVNLFADMGVQPATLTGGLVAATASTDNQAPTSTIVSPVNGSSFPGQTDVVISGTASDTLGIVAGVEVSVDGGTSWHLATGGASWTYHWMPSSPGSRVIKSRAIDDSGNLETPGGGIVVNVTCPCSIWDGTTTPAVASSGDASAVEVGVKFRSQVNGTITGFRFYKGAANTGTHTGHLWSFTGSTHTLLGTAVFSNETTTGWQRVDLTPAVAVAANTDYIVSYHSTSGNYSVDLDYFLNAGVNNPPLRALRNGENFGNGLFGYGPSGTFPSNEPNSCGRRDASARALSSTA